MNNKFQKFLPLGTVVLLKNAKKRIMVTGYLAKSPELENKIFDYIGCLYPEGILVFNENLLFNHDDIDQIFFIGYSDKEQKELMKTLENITSEQGK